MKNYIGIDVGGTNLRVGIVNSNGEIEDVFKVPTPTNSAEQFLECLLDLFKKCEAKSSLPIAGVGIGWPGPVNSQTGLIYETPNIGVFRNFNLISYFENKIPYPLYIENDAKCAGLAEKKFGQAQDFKNFILLTFGTGIGGCIYSSGQMIKGKMGLAGEIGHMLLYPKGQQCACGNYGCFERYCSSIALEKKAELQLGYPITAKEILEKYATNPTIENVLNEYVQDLSIALGSLANIFDPEAFIFSGGLFSSGGNVILSKLTSSIETQGFKSLKQKMQLLPTKLEGRAGIIGAAGLCF